VRNLFPTEVFVRSFCCLRAVRREKQKGGRRKKGDNVDPVPTYSLAELNPFGVCVHPVTRLAWERARRRGGGERGGGKRVFFFRCLFLETVLSPELKRSRFERGRRKNEGGNAGPSANFAFTIHIDRHLPVEHAYYRLLNSIGKEEGKRRKGKEGEKKKGFKSGPLCFSTAGVSPTGSRCNPLVLSNSKRGRKGERGGGKKGFAPIGAEIQDLVLETRATSTILNVLAKRLGEKKKEKRRGKKKKESTPNSSCLTAGTLHCKRIYWKMGRRREGMGGECVVGGWGGGGGGGWGVGTRRFFSSALFSAHLMHSTADQINMGL